MALKAWNQLDMTWPPPGSYLRRQYDQWLVTAGDKTPGRLPARIAFIGDSRSTCPGGAGRLLQAPMAAMLASIYGNMPGTGFWSAKAAGRDQGGVPLVVAATNGGSAAPITSTYVPPGITVQALVSGNNGVACVASDGWYYCNRSFNYCGGKFLDRSSTQLYPEIVGACGGGQAALTWELYSTNGSTPSFSGNTLITSGQTAALVGDGTTYRREIFPSSRQAFPTPSNGVNAAPYMLLRVTGAHASNTAWFAGASLNDYANPHGVIPDFFGNGGDKVSDHNTSFANCGAFFAARQHDAYHILFGANDAANNVSADTFKSNLQATISRIRTADPGKPIYLSGDYYRGGLTGPQLAELDKYPGACYELAQENAMCIFINLRRALEKIGWNSVQQVSVGSPSAWATNTTYAAGNIRTYSNRYWRCLYPHTSAGDASDAPGLEGDASTGYWEQVTGLLQSDLVHPSGPGGVEMARAIVNLMFAGIGAKGGGVLRAAR